MLDKNVYENGEHIKVSIKIDMAPARKVRSAFFLTLFFTLNITD